MQNGALLIFVHPKQDIFQRKNRIKYISKYKFKYFLIYVIIVCVYF
jgi:hypothetical protein